MFTLDDVTDKLDGTTGKLAKALAFGSAVYTTYTQAEGIYDRYKEWKIGREEKLPVYKITIDDDDSLYIWLSIWLNQFGHKKDSLLAELYGNSVRFKSNIEAVSSFKIDDHVIFISFDDNKDDDATANAGGLVVNTGYYTKKVSLFTHNLEAFGALKKFLGELPTQFFSSEKVEYLYTPNKDGAFRMSGRLIKRPIETVFLSEGTLESFIEDIETFFDHKERYINFGIPYHRGYLLYGPPGTGKTSIVKALATEYSMNVYSASLNDINSDREMSTMVNEIGDNSIFLMEDVDAFSVAVNREDGNASDGLSLSGLLNALDGVQTLHNCIIIMTSNHPERLDPALLRPGRIDQKIHIGYVDTYQLTNMIKAFTGEDHVIDVTREVAPAEIIEVFKSNMRTPENCIAEIKEIVS